MTGVRTKSCLDCGVSKSNFNVFETTMRASILLVLFACVALSTAQYCINNPGSCVRIRQSAGTSAPILACAPHEARLTVDGQVRMADGMNWRRVQYNGAWGWAAVQYLTPCSGGGSTGGGTTTTGCNFGAGSMVAAYRGGENIGTIEVVTIQGKPVEKRTACALTQMAAAARSSGLALKLNSGFRSMEEQQYLYNCYRTGSCNEGRLAAKPGYSNHQSGIAVDLSTGGGAYEWLAANAHKYGFVRTVPSEKWHWEYRPGSPRASYT